MSKTAPLLEVSEPSELHALLRAVVTAKFRPVSEDPLLWSSPIIHGLTARIRDALLEVERPKYGAAQAELWYRSLPDNELLGVIKENLRVNATQSWWVNMSPEAKSSFVRGCVEPFLVSEEFIGELIREAEA